MPLLSMPTRGSKDGREPAEDKRSYGSKGRADDGDVELDYRPFSYRRVVAGWIFRLRRGDQGRES